MVWLADRTTCEVTVTLEAVHVVVSIFVRHLLLDVYYFRVVCSEATSFRAHSDHFVDDIVLIFRYFGSLEPFEDELTLVFVSITWVHLLGLTA